MGVIERKGGASWSDRHPHEPKIKRQLASNGACFICELMEETRVAERRLRGAVEERDALAKLVALYRENGSADLTRLVEYEAKIAERGQS